MRKYIKSVYSIDEKVFLIDSGRIEAGAMMHRLKYARILSTAST